jgi:methionyl-tRNA formyltransferase
MRIFILTMEDPVFTLPFIKEIIDKRTGGIIGIALSKGSRLTIGKKRSKLVYLFSLLLIVGVIHYVKYSWITFSYRIKKKLSKKIKIIPDPSILCYAKAKGIKTFNIRNPNNKKFLAKLKKLDIDIIINQSQAILKQDLLAVPRIGVLNRHNALLPKNRGRLAPFWALYKGDKETGVSIHFVDEGLDSGDIIVQEKFEVVKNDTFNTLVKKNYEIASRLMFKALDMLESGNYTLIPNDDRLSTYNSPPTFRQALKFRWQRTRRFFS